MAAFTTSPGDERLRRYQQIYEGARRDGWGNAEARDIADRATRGEVQNVVASGRMYAYNPTYTTTEPAITTGTYNPDSTFIATDEISTIPEGVFHELQRMVSDTETTPVKKKNPVNHEEIKKQNAKKKTTVELWKKKRSGTGHEFWKEYDPQEITRVMNVPDGDGRQSIMRVFHYQEQRLNNGRGLHKFLEV